ncbi:hypothetical protein ACFLXV_00155 [Chloroflexota bacterium]
MNLLLKVVFMPIKMLVAGLMVQLALLLVSLAVVAVLVYFAYQWIT